MQCSYLKFSVTSTVTYQKLIQLPEQKRRWIYASWNTEMFSCFIQITHPESRFIIGT